MADRLHRVGVEQHARFPAEGADLGHRLHGADLVVGEHYADQRGVGPQGGLHVLRADNSVFVHRQQGDLKSLLFQMLQRVEDGVVLEGGGDQVLFSLPGRRLGRHFQRPVVGFAAAGGEEDLLRAAAEAFRHRGAGVVHRLAGGLPETVQGRGVAVLLGQIRGHGLQHRGQEAGCRGVVRVYKAIFQRFTGFLLILGGGSPPCGMVVFPSNTNIYSFGVYFNRKRTKKGGGTANFSRIVPPFL